MKLKVSVSKPTADLYDFRGQIAIIDNMGNSKSYELKENQFIPRGSVIK